MIRDFIGVMQQDNIRFKIFLFQRMFNSVDNSEQQTFETHLTFTQPEDIKSTAIVTSHVNSEILKLIDLYSTEYVDNKVFSNFDESRTWNNHESVWITCFINRIGAKIASYTRRGPVKKILSHPINKPILDLDSRDNIRPVYYDEIVPRDVVYFMYCNHETPYDQSIHIQLNDNGFEYAIIPNTTRLNYIHKCDFRHIRELHNRNFQ